MLDEDGSMFFSFDPGLDEYTYITDRDILIGILVDQTAVVVCEQGDGYVMLSHP